jgi:hypothetical protein
VGMGGGRSVTKLRDPVKTFPSLDWKNLKKNCLILPIMAAAKPKFVSFDKFGFLGTPRKNAFKNRTELLKRKI